MPRDGTFRGVSQSTSYQHKMKKLNTAISAGAVAAACLCTAGAAQAASFTADFTPTSFGTDTAHLVITTAGNASSWESVLSITGTVSGLGITGLIPVISSLGNDNLYQTNNPFFTEGGISFFDTAGTTWGMFEYGTDIYLANNVSYSIGGLHANMTAAVPEPESYAMLFAGLGALGAMSRRKRNQAKQMQAVA
jgi:hypothetical protein